MGRIPVRGAGQRRTGDLGDYSLLFHHFNAKMFGNEFNRLDPVVLRMAGILQDALDAQLIKSFFQRHPKLGMVDYMS